MRRGPSDVWEIARPAGPIFAIALLASAAPSGRLTAQQQPLNSGALFLVLPVGAQSVGTGQAALAADGTDEAVFWNPAGLATLTSDAFGLHSAALPAGNTNAVTLFFPSHAIGVLGAAVYLVDYGNFDRTDSLNNTLARISSRNVEFMASYATTLTSNVTFGVTYKLVEFTVDCSGECQDFPNGEGVTHALDAGAQVALSSGLRLGFAVRNVGFKLQVQNRDQADPLPTRVAIGGRYDVPLGRLAPANGDTAGGPAQRFDLQLAADIDSPWGDYASSEMRVGVDFGYQHVLRLRGGYAFVRDGLSGPSVGVGVSSGAIGFDLARTFLTGSDLLATNPTFVSFRLAF